MVKNGGNVKFDKQKSYIMINNNLGGGSCGTTVLIEDPFIKEQFVAKKYTPDENWSMEYKDRFYNDFINEIKIMFKANHPNVCRIYNYYPYENNKTAYIIMEYIQGVTLEEKCKQIFDGDWLIEYNDDFTDIFQQLIVGFEYLESIGIVHRDIREKNIMISNDGTVKIIDFGFGKQIEKQELSEDSVNDLINRIGVRTLPSEYKEGLYTFATDIYFLGDLIYRILEKYNVLEDFPYKSILDKMVSQNINTRYNSFSDILDDMNELRYAIIGFNNGEKVIYNSFANQLYNSISNYKEKPNFEKNISQIETALKTLLLNNSMEEELISNTDLISIFVHTPYKYYTNRKNTTKSVSDFYKWFTTRDIKTKQLILNMLIYKLSKIRIEIDDELPF